MSAIKLPNFNSEAFAAVRVLAGFLILAINFARSYSGSEGLFASTPEASHASLLFYAFCIVHALRVWFGLYFIERDRSFRIAVEAQRSNIGIRNRLLRVQYICYAILFVTTGLFSAAVSGQLGQWGLAIVLLIQTACIGLFDAYHYPTLLKIDEERASNWVFIIGDALVLIVVIAYICCLTFGDGIHDIIANSIGYLLTGLAVAFLAECATQYIRSIFGAFKHIRSDFRIEKTI